MACVRKRRGKFVLDYRDVTGRRRWQSFDLEREAKAELMRVMEETGPQEQPDIDPDITVGAYAERWLSDQQGFLKPRTLESYSWALTKHILPEIGATRVRRVSRTAVKTLVTIKLREGLSKSTVRIIRATLHAMLNEAIEDGVIKQNPAANRSRSKRTRMMQLSPSRGERQENIKAMASWEIRTFLEATRQHEPRNGHPARRSVCCPLGRPGHARPEDAGCPQLLGGAHRDPEVRQGQERGHQPPAT